MEEKYIATLDIGTTTIRCYIYNSKAETVGKAVDQIILQYPEPGYVEIDPDILWTSIKSVVEKSMKDARLSSGQITAMAISTQRSTFITWSRKTGKHFHNFITWKDLRADDLVKKWNKSYTWMAVRAGAYALYVILRSKRFRAGSVLKFMNTQTTLRFCWAVNNIPELKKAVQIGDAMFGTLDSWLLYKLTGRKLHVTDVSSASATGFFDPFTMNWASWALGLFSLPGSSLPAVVDTAGKHFTATDPTIWGHSIPILSCMADQTASMWGSCCFEPGDLKLTMGTGTFFNINTGPSAHASVSGLYPVVGWQLGKDLVYVAEGANNDTGSIIKWAQNIGLFDKPEETATLANSVSDSDGAFFIPAFSGLGPPYNDATAASGFVGVKASTSKAHLVRAVLESLAFRTALLYQCVRAETNYNFHTIRMDGGVSNNDFIVQLVADLTGLRVERPVHVEMSSLGAAFISGLHLGIWKSKEELLSLRKIERVFNPRASVKAHYLPILSRWEDAVKRMSGWYSDNNSKQSLNTVADSSHDLVDSQNNLKLKSSMKRNGHTK